MCSKSPSTPQKLANFHWNLYKTIPKKHWPSAHLLQRFSGQLRLPQEEQNGLGRFLCTKILLVLNVGNEGMIHDNYER